jgi:hypothetical protein
MRTDLVRSRRMIRRAVRLAQRLMPSDGDLDGLLANVSRHRGRPLTLLEGSMSRSLGRSGLCLITDDADYILLEPRTSPSRRATIICHEVSHLLLGHEGDSSSDITTRMAPDLDPSLVARMLARHSYMTLEEEEAEVMATLLVTEHVRRQQAARLTSGDFRTERIF